MHDLNKIAEIYIGLPIIYTVISLSRISKGFVKNIVFALLILISSIIGYIYDTRIFFILLFLILFGFTLFYDDEPFKIQMEWEIPYFLICIFLLFFIKIKLLSITIPIVSIILILIMKKQRDLLVWICPIVIGLVLYFIDNYYIIFVISFLLLILIDRIISLSNSSLEISTNLFQRKLVNTQYNEIKELYLQMRGYRHDYHNHLQSMKVYLKENKVEKLSNYLNELEGELNEISLLVNTGHDIIDAILNSKLTLARKQDIKVNVKAKVNLEKQISINDTDFCIIIGNLIDNAIEGCMEIDEDKRFIRVYLDTIEDQFYLSIQNSAKEILSFEEKNYISTKRGNHGLGIKRVNLIVESYGGFLNLQNQPGIFASEVSMPLN